MAALYGREGKILKIWNFCYLIFHYRSTMMNLFEVDLDQKIRFGDFQQQQNMLIMIRVHLLVNHPVRGEAVMAIESCPIFTVKQ